MPMIECRECGKPISTKSTSCPHCGAARRKTSQLLKVVILLMFAGVAYTTFMGSDKDLTYEIIDRKARTLSFDQISTYSESIEGTTVTWTGTVTGINESSDPMKIVNFAPGKSSMAGVQLEVSEDVAARLKIGRRYEATGTIKNVVFAFVTTIVRLQDVTIQ